MITLHTEILKREGKKQFAILPFEEYEMLLECIEDMEDLKDLRKAKKASLGEPSISIDQVRKKLNLTS